MKYLGLIDVTLTYRSAANETQVSHTGVSATLLLQRQQNTWMVLIDDKENSVALDDLVRAEVVLADGRQIAGDCHRTSLQGKSFELVEGPLSDPHESRMETIATFSSIDQLRELLAGVPGTAKVSIEALPTGVQSETLALLTAIGDGELSPQRVASSATHRVTSVCICEARGIGQQE